MLKDADAGDGEGWLIVDDLVDTGSTARVVRERLPKALFATIYANPLAGPWSTPSSRKSAKTPGSYFPGMWHWLMRHPSVAANRPATLHTATLSIKRVSPR